MELEIVQEKYWDKALPEIVKKNPNSFKNHYVYKNALNGSIILGVQFYCVANTKKKKLDANTIASGLYIEIGKSVKNLETEKRKRINKKIYDLLRKEEMKEKIPDIVWNENPNKMASSILLVKEIDYTNMENWQECIDFHASTSRLLYDVVFKPCRDEIARFLNSMGLNM